MEVISRSIESNKIQITSLLDWNEAEEKIKDTIAKEKGIKKEKIEELDTYRRVIPQVSINSDGRITIRIYPLIEVSGYKYNGEWYDYREMFAIQDVDVVLVLDKDTSRKLYEFIKSTDTSIFRW